MSQASRRGDAELKLAVTVAAVGCVLIICAILILHGTIMSRFVDYGEFTPPFHIESIALLDDGRHELRFTAQSDRVYRIEQSDALTNGWWEAGYVSASPQIVSNIIAIAAFPSTGLSNSPVVQVLVQLDAVSNRVVHAYPVAWTSSVVAADSQFWRVREQSF